MPANQPPQVTQPNNKGQAPQLFGMIQVIVAAICWGTLGIFSTYLSHLGFTGWQVTTLRVVTAALLLLVLLPSLWAPLKQLKRKHWQILGIQSIVGVLGMTACFFFAVIHSGVAMAVALLYTAPVFSLIFAHFLLGERMTSTSTMLACLAFLGVALTMAGQGVSINIGLVVGLLSGVCYSMLGIMGKKAMQDAAFAKAVPNPSKLIFFTSVVISAVVLLFVPQTYGTYQAMFTMPNLSWVSWLYVLGISAVGTIIPFFLYMNALEKLPATKASVFTIFEPLTAIILAMVMLGQSISPVQGVGVSFIILAALLNAVLS